MEITTNKFWLLLYSVCSENSENNLTVEITTNEGTRVFQIALRAEGDPQVGDIGHFAGGIFYWLVGA